MGDALACVFNTAGLYVERRWMKKATGDFFFVFFFEKKRGQHCQKRGGFRERTSVTGRVREVETL